MTDTVQSFSAMLRQALGDRLAPDAETFVDMVADDVVMEFPYAPPGLPTAIEGKGAIIAHLRMLATKIDLAGVGAPTVYPGEDPSFVVVEFTASGRGVETGVPYEQRYVSLIWTGGGRIVRYRDYWNPLAVLRALKGEEAMTANALEWRHDG